MNIVLTTAKIKALCGATSVKRGQMYVDTGKVELGESSANFFEGVVHGTELFQVKVEAAGEKIVRATCSCPTLEGIRLSCQHVAAVLLKQMAEQTIIEQMPLADEVLQIFSSSQPTYIQQRNFETRTILPIQYVLQKQLTNEGALFSILLQVDFEEVSSVTKFVQAFYEGQPYMHYHPDLHVFSPLDEEILLVLYKVSKATSIHPSEDFLLSATGWQMVRKALGQSDNVTIILNNERYYTLHDANNVPPLVFDFCEYGEDVRLTVKGFQRMHLFKAYEMIFHEGQLYEISHENALKYEKLQALMQHKNELIIPAKQFEPFLKQAAQGFKQIGHVKLSPRLQREQLEFPLQAHLYLDRLNGKLLAGVEFHYGQIKIQPLEVNNSFSIMRDEEKEQQLLHEIESSGFTKTEGGYYLQNEELEYSFLMHMLPKLQKAMKVYAAMAVRLRVLKDTVFPRIRIKAFNEKTNWVEFKFELDGIKDADVLAVLNAIKMKQKYYRLPNGSIFSLETKEVEEIQRFLQAAPVQLDDYEATLNMPVQESLKFLSLFEGSDAFKMEQSFKEIVEQLKNPKLLDEPVPERLEAVLRPYQIEGYRWMKLLSSYGFGGVLADEMGLGKTIQSIAFIVSELNEIRESREPVVIICPSSLTYNWLSEFAKFAPELQVQIIEGTAKERKYLLQQVAQIDVLITSYPLLRKDIMYYEQMHFHTIFYDEAQAFKNPFSQTARAVHKLKASNRFALTGTPLENSIEELWSIFKAVFPQLFGTLQAFSELQTKDISLRVRPFMLRRLKADVLKELPAKLEHVQYSELTKEQKKLYAAFLTKLKHDTFKHLGKESFKKNKIKILAGITRLRQLCCHPTLFVEGYEGDSGKFLQLQQIVQEAKRSNRRVLIFSQFTQMLKVIAKYLAEHDMDYFYLDGATKSEERVQLCERFNEGERDIFLISLKAGGTGLNLTGADTVILYDLWWNPAVEAQAMGRAHRMGQKKTVEVLKLVSKGTIEEKIHDLQQRKQILIADVLEENKTINYQLNEDDIREILF